MISPLMSTSGAGCYSPLKSDSSTRLLTLFPGSGLDPLKGSVDEIDLVGDHVLYEAISYTWGAARNGRPLYIDGALTTLWENLSTCLTHLRDPVISRTLWIDAICIAQNEPIEKAQQVEMMAQIFGHAERVLAWIGDHSDDSQNLVSSFYQENDSTKFMRVFASLLERPYWTRRWVIQELVAAQQVVVCCGQSRWNWHAFIDMAYHARTLTEGGVACQMTTRVRKAINTLAEVDWMQDNAPRSRWPDLLMNFIHMQCTDSRDKAYSLISLADQDELHGSKLRSDYKIDLPELTTRLLARSFARGNFRHPWERLGTAMLNVHDNVANATIRKIVNGLGLDDSELQAVRALLTTKSESPCIDNTAADWPNVVSDTGQTPGDFWRCLAELFNKLDLGPDTRDYTGD